MLPGWFGRLPLWAKIKTKGCTDILGTFFLFVLLGSITFLFKPFHIEQRTGKHPVSTQAMLLCNCGSFYYANVNVE